MHGLFRTLTDNMVVGVSKGFDKRLQLIGVGYCAVVEGKDIVLSLGFSHPVRRMTIPDPFQKGEGRRKHKTTNPPLASLLLLSESGGLQSRTRGRVSTIKYADEVIRRKEGKQDKKK